MNLQDKNLHKKKIKKETRMLKALGVDGLFLSKYKKGNLLNIVGKHISKDKEEKIKVLFVGDYISQGDLDEGLLFSNILTKGMKLVKEDYRILDTTTWSLDHLNLKTKLIDYISIHKPTVVLVFGEKISQIILDSSESISNLRGNFVNFCATKLMCTLDLSLLIKDASKKKLVWNDIKKVNKEVENEK